MSLNNYLFLNTLVINVHELFINVPGGLCSGCAPGISGSTLDTSKLMKLKLKLTKQVTTVPSFSSFIAYNTCISSPKEVSYIVHC